MQVQVVILLALATVGYSFPSGMCALDTCQNGGTCLDMGSMYMCVCSDQFLGEHCERPDATSRVIGLTADPCTPNPCQNGGLCFTRDRVGASGMTYHCSCLRPYGGLNCDEAVVEARQTSPCDVNPCQNGGACEESATAEGGYVCQCTESWKGSNCQTLPCDMDPCLNGGDCFTGYRNKGSYMCRCAPGYKGNNCEIGDPCMDNPCGQGNLCIPNRDDNTFSCMCPCSPGGSCQNSGGDGTDNSGSTDGGSGTTDGSTGSGSDSGNSGSGTGNTDNTLPQTGNDGYNGAVGHRCDMMMRESHNCSNHGVCSYDGDRDIVICTCEAGYSGDICQRGNGASSGSDSGSSGSDSGSSGTDSGSSGTDSGTSGTDSGSSGTGSGTSGTGSGTSGGTDDGTLAQTGDGASSSSGGQVSGNSDESRCARMMRETSQCSGHGYCNIDTTRDIAICRCNDGYSGVRCQNEE